MTRPWRMACRLLIGLFACAAIAILAAVGFAACIDAGLFRGAVIRFMSAHAGRPIEVAGALHAHLLARHPELQADHVVVDNPPWVPAGQMAEIGEVSLVMDVPWFNHRFGIVSVIMKKATLHLMRNAAGYANWQFTNPDVPPDDEKLPILRRLSIPDAHVMLDDQRRHLEFDGIVSADGADGGAIPRLTLKGKGKLNGHEDSFEVDADALTAASHKIPYRFEFTEHSSGSDLKGHGSLPRPFDFDIVDASFEAAGADLTDLYFLTGVTLINSGNYRLSGNILRRGASTFFTDLKVTTGQSNVRGNVSIKVSGGRARLSIDLESKLLKMADFGLKAAGRDPGTGPHFFLSNAAFKPSTLRLGDADVRYRARQLQIGSVRLGEVAAKGSIERGVLTAAPLTAEMFGGEVSSRMRLDARTDEPKASVDITVTGLKLAELPAKDPATPPATGLLQVRIAVNGVGTSVHQVAATANGTVALAVQQGTIRDSIAEMTGVDLRGLGLVLTKSQKEIPLRCATGAFDARAGTLTAKQLVADTEPVLITAEGRIHFDTETFDLAISGHPKHLRLLRFRAPVLIKGTFTHPAVDVQARKLTLVDPGNAKDANCAELESSAPTPDPAPMR